MLSVSHFVVCSQVEPDTANRLPLAQLARPSCRVFLSGEFIELLALFQDKRIRRRLALSGCDERLCPDGCASLCCGGNYPFLTQTGLPKAFHKLMMLAMITPSPCCDAILCVNRVAPRHRLIREICAAANDRTPSPYLLWNA